MPPSDLALDLRVVEEGVDLDAGAVRHLPVGQVGLGPVVGQLGRRNG